MDTAMTEGSTPDTSRHATRLDYAPSSGTGRTIDALTLYLRALRYPPTAPLPGESATVPASLSLDPNL